MRGPDSARALLPPGRGRGSSVSSIVCFLTGLSHIDPVAQPAAARALPQRGAELAARHRPRLPPRHPRAADPARARALRPRPLGAGGRLPHLPRAGSDPRPGRGAGAAAGGDRAGGAGLGGLERTRGGPRHRGRAGRAPRQHRALAVAGGAGAPGRGPAAPPLPALGRDGRGHPAADRLLPGGAGGDGGPPDRAVGQGLLRRRRLPQDRPAGTGDAVGGRALRGGGGARARRADRPLAHPLRRPRDLRRDPAADTVGVFQIESRAQMQSLLRTRPATLDDLTVQVAIVRPGPIQGGAVNPYIERRQRLREDPSFQVPYDHPSPGAGAARHPGHDHLPGPGAGGGDRLRRLLAGRGRRAAPGHEPQALVEAAIEAHHRRFVEGAMARHGVRGGAGRAGVADGGRLLGLRLPQGPRGGVRAAGLPVDLAARALLPRVPVRAAQRAADGLLPARRPGPRRPAARDRGAPARPRAQPGAVHGAGRRGGAGRAGLRARGARGRRARAGGCPPPSSPAGASARWRRQPRPPASPAATPTPGATRWSAWPGRAPATAWRNGSRRGGRCGRWASPPPAAASRRAPSWRWSWICPTPPSCRELGGWESMLADYGADRDGAGRPPAEAAAPHAAGRGGVLARPAHASPTARACRSAAWWWPASARAPPTAWCSCCWRTSTARST